MQINSLGKNRASGLKVKKLSKSSPFFISGIRSGDVIVAINGERIHDELEFHFFSADSNFEVEIVRNAQNRKIEVDRAEGSFSEIDFFENPINRCRNRCIFCFIDQMPKGLRRGLYIKDEDFKHSFLNGNYVTLTGAKKSDLEKIVMIGLSPLFISVHATDNDVRRVMLGNKKAPDIMEQLSFLADNYIAFHAQIVVCPGYNDQDVLLKTIKDLFNFNDSLLSIAVVPVGLTDFRKIVLQPVTKEIAADLCTEMMALSDMHAQKDGRRRLFVADEFLIKANLPIPSRKFYEDYPQIENGVGLVRQLLEEWNTFKRDLKRGKIAQLSKKGKFLVVTSLSAGVYVKKIVQDALSLKMFNSAHFNVVPVTNRYFGEMVTVAGLLTAKDVIAAIKRELLNDSYTSVILPAVMFNYAGFTLDGYSVNRISAATGVQAKIAGSLQDLFTI